MSDNLLTILDLIFRKAQDEKIFPGAAIGISVGHGREREYITKAYGSLDYNHNAPLITESTFFDLASLTKPLATTLAILALLHEKKISLDDDLASLLEVNIPADKKDIKIRHLLNHCSGLPGHREYFRELINFPLIDRKEQILRMILGEPILARPGEMARYSDLGFILLGVIVEKISNLSLADFVAKNIFTPLHLTDNLFFYPELEQKKNIIVAPTEECQWRQRLIQGEVGDENAYALGGVAGHAGLFGDIGAVLKMTTHLLDQWLGREEFFAYSNDDLQSFLRRQKLVKGSTWALGFDTPSKIKSSAGAVSSASVGHLGFTGTSFWLDPQRDLVMVLLTNRVHPRRDNEKIKKFRPLFHNTVIDFLRNMEN